MLNLRCSNREFKDIYVEGNTIAISGNKIVADGSDYYKTILDNLDNESKLRFSQWVGKTYGSSMKYLRVLMTNKKVTLTDYRFITIRNGYEIEVFYQLNENSKELIRVTSSVEPKFEDKITQFVRYFLADSYYLSLTAQRAKKEIMSLILSKNFDKHINISKWTNNPETYTYAYINLDNLIGNPTKDTPAWDSFTNQFELPEDVEAFRYFIYSIFYCSNLSRQMLWLQGEGDSGKSRVTSCVLDNLNEINNKLGIVIASRNNRDKYSFSGLEHSRLALISDTKQRNLLKEEFMLQISGDDAMPVRKMYSDEKNVKAFSKIWITSNYSPMVDLDSKHETSRLLYISMKNNLNSWKIWEEQYPDVEWKDKLHEEFPDFLAKCKIAYDENVNSKGNFELTDNMIQRLIKAGSSQYIPLIRLFMNNLLVEDDESVILIKELGLELMRFIYGRQTNYCAPNLSKHLDNFLKCNHDVGEVDMEGESIKVLKGYRYISGYKKYSLLDLQKKMLNNLTYNVE